MALPINGVLNLDKPPGITSAALLARVKWLLPMHTKVGHAGALDPFATGVLVVLIGRATRLDESIMGAPKQYRATIKLGATTESDDPDTPEIISPHATPPTRDQLLAAIAMQVGLIEQLPPAYSALKIGGKRACDRVRAGEHVKLTPRKVRVDKIELIDYVWPSATLLIDCGRGTYVRAIARDIGRVLGTGAYITQLCRTRVGDFNLTNASAIDSLTREKIVDSMVMQDANTSTKTRIK